MRSNLSIIQYVWVASIAWAAISSESDFFFFGIVNANWKKCAILFRGGGMTGQNLGFVGGGWWNEIMKEGVICALLGFSGVVIGSLLQVFSTNFQLRKTSEVTSKNSNLERTRNIHDETLKFEHDNLVELQNLLIEHTRFIVIGMLEDRKSLIENQKLAN